MFATIRRHQKWMWGAIIAVIIPSFVIFFSPDVGIGDRRRIDVGTMGGRPIPQEDFAKAYYETELRYWMSNQEWPSQQSSQFGFDVEREARNRLLMIKKLEDLGIRVPDVAAAQWLSRVFRDQRGTPSSVLYDQFVNNVLRQHGLRESDMERFVRHEVGLQHLVQVAGLNGRLVTPREAEALYRIANEQMEAQAVLFSASNYLDRVSVNEADLAQFYTNRMANYRIPKRVQVKYLKFDSTNYLEEANQQLTARFTNLNEVINSIYQDRGARFFTDTNNQVMPETQAKERVKEEMLKQQAMLTARKQAGEFAVQLDERSASKGDEKVAPTVEDLEKLAAEKNLQVQISEPFTEFEPPRNMGVLDNFGRAAFALSPQEPIAPPVVGEEAIYIIAYHKEIPSEMPPLERVRDRVVQDYRQTEALRMAREAGMNFQTILTNSLAQGKSFAQVAEEAKVKAIQIPPFSLSTSSLTNLDERLDLSRIKSLARDLKPGKASPFSSARDGGMIVYLQSRTPVDEAKMKAELPEFTANLARSRQFEAFADWLGQEIKQVGLAGPVVNTPEKTSVAQ